MFDDAGTALFMVFTLCFRTSAIKHFGTAHSDTSFLEQQSGSVDKEVCRPLAARTSFDSYIAAACPATLKRSKMYRAVARHFERLAISGVGYH